MAPSSRVPLSFASITVSRRLAVSSFHSNRSLLLVLLSSTLFACSPWPACLSCSFARSLSNRIAFVLFTVRRQSHSKVDLKSIGFSNCFSFAVRTSSCFSFFSITSVRPNHHPCRRTNKLFVTFFVCFSFNFVVPCLATFERNSALSVTLIHSVVRRPNPTSINFPALIWRFDLAPYRFIDGHFTGAFPAQPKHALWSHSIRLASIIDCFSPSFHVEQVTSNKFVARFECKGVERIKSNRKSPQVGPETSRNQWISPVDCKSAFVIVGRTRFLSSRPVEPNQVLSPATTCCRCRCLSFSFFLSLIHVTLVSIASIVFIYQCYLRNQFHSSICQVNSINTRQLCLHYFFNLHFLPIISPSRFATKATCFNKAQSSLFNSLQSNKTGIHSRIHPTFVIIIDDIARPHGRTFVDLGSVDQPNSPNLTFTLLHVVFFFFFFFLHRNLLHTCF